MVAKWASVTNLGKIFDIGRTKVTELVHQMEIDPEYKDNVISFSHKKKSVNIEAFQEFLITKVNRKWLKQTQVCINDIASVNPKRNFRRLYIV